MTTWQHSAPSNPTAQTPQHNLSLGEDSPSDLPELQEEETLEFQEEYPQEEAEEAEEEASPQRYLFSKLLLVQETNSSAIRHLYSPEIAQNRRCS